MIYVTHDQIEALTLADRIAVMKGGVIQQLATPAGDLSSAGQPVRRRLHRLAGDEFPRRARWRRRAAGASRRLGECDRSSPAMRFAGAAPATGRSCSASGPSTSRSATAPPASHRRRGASRSSSRWAPTPSSGRGSPGRPSPSASTATTPVRRRRRDRLPLRSPPAPRCSTRRRWQVRLYDALNERTHHGPDELRSPSSSIPPAIFPRSRLSSRSSGRCRLQQCRALWRLL